MLLDDFVKPIIMETPADDMRRKGIPPALEKAEPNAILSSLLTLESIPSRYFLGYTDPDQAELDQNVSQYYHVGYDSQGILDQPGNWHVYIGGTKDFSISNPNIINFYRTLFPDETEVIRNEDEVEVINLKEYPLNTAKVRAKELKAWCKADGGQTRAGTDGHWFRLKGDGKLSRIKQEEFALLHKKLMLFSGFDEKGNRSLESLEKHREENEKRILNDRARVTATPLKDGDKAQIPGFKDPDTGKSIVFMYKGTPPEGHWESEFSGKITVGSPEHDILMNIKGKQSNGVDLLEPPEQLKIFDILSNPFKLRSYTKKGMRFQLNPKLNAMGKLFGVIGDVAGSYMKTTYDLNKVVADFRNNKKGFKILADKFGTYNYEDPEGKLFDKTNVDSFVNVLQKSMIRNIDKGNKVKDEKGNLVTVKELYPDFVTIKKLLDEIAADYKKTYGKDPAPLMVNDDDPLTSVNNRRVKDRKTFDAYGDNIYRLQDKIKFFVTPNFKEGDLALYKLESGVDRGKFRGVNIVSLLDNNYNLVIVQDTDQHTMPPLGRIQGTNEFEPLTNMDPRTQKYREEFTKIHKFSLPEYIIKADYNLAYLGKKSNVVDGATKEDILKLSNAYKELSGSKWSNAQRKDILNRFGIFLIRGEKLRKYNPDAVTKFTKEIDNEIKLLPSPDTELKNPLSTILADDNQLEKYLKELETLSSVNRDFTTGENVYFFAGKNTSKQGQMITGRVIGPIRNKEGKPGATVGFEPGQEDLIWLKTKDNDGNGFNISRESLMTVQQKDALDKLGLSPLLDEYKGQKINPKELMQKYIQMLQDGSVDTK
tara:strand:- start:9494 stop:11956 length:2463 start_codon:yes stop_codon:yes gene_type:complete